MRGDATAPLGADLQSTLQTALTKDILNQVPDEPVYLDLEEDQQPDEPLFPVERVVEFFDKLFIMLGWTDCSSTIDQAGAINDYVNATGNMLFLWQREIGLSQVRHLITHELGHMLRRRNGALSQIGLLQIGTARYQMTEEGVLIYQERAMLTQQGLPYNDAGMRLAVLAISLASGSYRPPLNFYSLAQWIERFAFTRLCLQNPMSSEQMTYWKKSRSYAVSLTERTLRGVRDEWMGGVCSTRDMTHWRGLRKIEQAVAADPSLLRRLSVGRISLEDLPAIEEAGITAPLTGEILWEIANDSHLEQKLR
jgi:hypothetical protein